MSEFFFKDFDVGAARAEPKVKNKWLDAIWTMRFWTVEAGAYDKNDCAFENVSNVVF